MGHDIRRSGNHGQESDSAWKVLGSCIATQRQKQMTVVKIKFRDRLKLIWGTPRRLFLNVFRPGYVRSSLAKRSGECRRCGACCRLVRRCRYFHDDDGIPACRLYAGYRPPNCSKFPIDRRDLADRDLVSPIEPCGFLWAVENIAQK